MKVVYMGTPQFAVPSLQALYDAGHHIQLVVTQPDRKGNRGKVIPSPVKALALELGLPVAQPYVIRKEPDFIEELKALAPDIIVVAAFGQILPEEVLNLPKYGCINVHGSLLPRWRGASPMQACILAGDEKTGVTIMQMAKGLDTGDMLTKAECEIGEKYITELAGELEELGAKLLVETMTLIEEGKITPEAQNDDESCYAHIIKKSDGATDFNEPAEVLVRKLRAYYEWPTLHSYLGDLSVKFYGAEAVSEIPDGEPGVVCSVDKNSFTVNCKGSKLRITELQLQGKKRLMAGDFLRGSKLAAGDRFILKED